MRTRNSSRCRFWPINVTQELEGAKQYFLYKERCVFCDIIRQETENGSRVVAENEKFPDYRSLCATLPVRDLDSPETA